MNQYAEIHVMVMKHFTNFTVTDSTYSRTDIFLLPLSSFELINKESVKVNKRPNDPTELANACT
jgi:hypothetical protein